jgi:hypothetical protein
MKKIFLIVNVCFVITLVLFACHNRRIGAGTSDAACLRMHAKDYSGKLLEKYLDVRLAKEITDLYYRDKEKSYISNGGPNNGLEDAKAIWFSLDDLKHYIWQIEDTLCKQGCDINKLDLGLHVYFAKYPGQDRIKEFDVDPKYADHQTVFFTATYRGNKNNIDFDPFHPGSDKCRPTPLAEYLKRASNAFKNSSGKQSIFMGPDGFTDDGAGVFNHGGLRPPPAGEGGFPSNDN